MSYTSCPGDAFYPVVHTQLQAMVQAERARMAAAQGTTARAPYRVDRRQVKP
jgi:outer membrane murein-binding lipoprotein Lpp